MTYLLLTIKDLPRVAFTHAFESDKYSMRFRPRANFLELTDLEEGDITVSYVDGQKVQMPAPGFIVNVHRTTSKASSNSPNVKHTTVGILVEYTYQEISAKEVCALQSKTLLPSEGQPFMAIVPFYLPTTAEHAPIKKKLAQIVRTDASLNPAKTLRNAGLVLSLLADLTAISVNMALLSGEKKFPSGAMVYCRRAMQYVHAHLHEKISTVAIAEELDLSPGYLSKIFRETTGQTLVSYIGQMKMEKVKNLIFAHNFSLKHAGEQVGITDQNYLSRLFKQHTGLTVQEYKSMRFSPGSRNLNK